MVATLCTMFFSILAQDINYREWVFTDNTSVDAVAIYKVDVDVHEVKDWDKFFDTAGPKLNFIEGKVHIGETFFDIREEGVYCFVGGNIATEEITNQTCIVFDQDYIRVMKEQGWAEESNGILSSKPSPLRIARESATFVSAETMLD